MGRKTYTPKFRLNVVLEVLRSEKAEAEVQEGRGAGPAQEFLSES